MQGRIHTLKKRRIDVITERRMQHYLKELLSALHERGLDLKLPIVFAGGGAELPGHRLYSREVNTVVILDRFATNACWGDDMRGGRRYLTFDMENPRHREAFALFSAQSGRLRRKYIVDCVLQTQQEKRKPNIPDEIIESSARTLLPAIREYFDSEEAQREFVESKEN